ncbi:MAG: hypothetical protein COV99_05985 [Bacteroidetes bacterium CG12_big_fil_rev_8_21_14_0_65_60_17]|nr:MAG: hypothetical protein COV99_05985 [Bacteroidetes bacterium CG12_big_fil_rev_8_21_14_0_65_60_17]
MYVPSLSRLFPVLVILLAHTMMACGQSEPPVSSYVEGTLRVRGNVDETGDYRGFLVSVLNQVEGDVDTLATAETDASGFFSMQVRAPESGIYPLVVERSGEQMSLDQLVIVDGDSIRISGTYPLGNRPLIIRSPENASWSAYRNTKAVHSERLSALASDGNPEPVAVRAQVEQTASILWGIGDTYPQTMGARIARAESVLMVEGWNDSLVVARYTEIGLDNPSITEVIRAARRAVARERGQDAALDVVETYLERVSRDEQKAGLMSELVVAYSDSGDVEKALETASLLRSTYPGSSWADWASRASYDLENLQPGMLAPTFDVTSRTGERVVLEEMRGVFVILEFFDPWDTAFRQDMPMRDGLFGALQDNVFRVVSVSLEPDEDVNEALFDGGESHPGTFVWLPSGKDSPVVSAYNVHATSTRFLIDPDGRIVSKYVGRTLNELQNDLISIVTRLNELAGGE